MNRSLQTPRRVNTPCNRRSTQARHLALIAALLFTLPLGSALYAAGNDDKPAAAPATAEIGEISPIEPTLSADLIESKIKETEANSSLSDDAKAALLEQYQGVLSSLEQTKSFNAKAAAFKAAIEQAPEETASIRRKLEQRQGESPQPPVALSSDVDVKEIERLLAREQAESAANDAQIAELEKVVDDTAEQPAKARLRIAEAKAALESINNELGQSPTAGGGGDEQQARSWALQARRDALRAELLMLDQQISSADARHDLASAQLDRLAFEQKRLRARRTYLQNRADRLRQAEAQRMADETAAAERALAQSHPVVRKLAELNRILSDSISRVTGQLDQLDDRQAELERRTQRIEQDFRSARKRLEVASLNRALGQVLIDQRAQLPDVRKLRRQAEQYADEVADSTLNQIRDREDLRALDDLDGYLAGLLAKVNEAERAKVRPDLKQQAERRRQLLGRAIDVEDSYRRALTDLDFASRQLIDAVEGYDQFLSERLLWVRSIVPVTDQDFGALPAAVYWLISPRNWLDLGHALLYQSWRSPTLWLGLPVFALLLSYRSRMRRAIRHTAEHLRRVTTDRISYTLEALGLTLLVAAPWPLLFLTLGWQLQGSLDATAFSKAIGTALVLVAPALYYLSAFRLLCLRGGVADRHFRWSNDVLALLRHNFAWAASMLLPVGFVAAAIHQHQDPDFTGTLGRLSLALFDFGLAVFTARVMHPRRGALKHLLAARPTGWANRLRNLWYPLLVAVPLALGVLALTGYLYTSGTLLESLVSELWLILGLVVAHELIVRWLVVTRRSLALQAALNRRASREAQRETRDKGAAELPTVVESEVDLASLDAQTRRLLNLTILIVAAVGLWLIWADVLPALNVFDRVTLWTYVGDLDGASQSIPVTLADLGLVLVIILISAAAAKNLPGLLEILLLKNTSISGGSRYTITTLTRYAISAVGILLVFSTLGLSWGQVQWLVAALGVGIGFGLQEIVANFISGLIILFERPVRVGDIVTIGDTTGAVSKIEIRATTIRNWDKQELLVPNKEFITGRLLNWTLTDQINRITIPVGVEYGSDTRKARELLAQVAADNPRVLAEPAPIISFEEFGDNALTLILRCYLENLDYRLAVITELHQAIDDRFRAAGIGIAFPQRDLHLRSAEPLEVRFRRARTRGDVATVDQAEGPTNDSGTAEAHA